MEKVQITYTQGTAQFSACVEFENTIITSTALRDWFENYALPAMGFRREDGR